MLQENKKPFDCVVTKKRSVNDDEYDEEESIMTVTVTVKGDVVFEIDE